MKNRGDLKQKLGLLKKRGEKKIPRHVVNLHPGEGWEELEPFLFRRQRVESLDPEYFFPLDFPFLDKSFSSEEVIFFDLETTGLSGGAGNLAFLTGLGHFDEKNLVITQYFLADFPGEPGLIRELKKWFDPEKLFISYNGKSFDSHVLRTRFALKGEAFEIPRQFDLLYLCRRLWKRILGSCSLGDMETRVLGVTREGDVPGFLVPEIYFRFQKEGCLEELERVFYHNHMDILSLGLLLKKLSAILRGNKEGVEVDEASLGEFLLANAPSLGVKTLGEAFLKGNLRAGKILSLYWKREGAWDKALSLWEELFRQHNSYFAAMELAKFYEHRRKEISRALEYVQHFSRKPFPLGREKREELARREERLVKKKEIRLDISDK